MDSSKTATIDPQHESCPGQSRYHACSMVQEQHPLLCLWLFACSRSRACSACLLMRLFLSEIILASILAQKEAQAKQQQQRLPALSPTSPTSPTSMTSASRAVAIVDPSSGAPLYIPPATVNTKPTHAPTRPGRYSGSTTPATAGLMAQSDSYFGIMPSMGRQQQHQHQHQHQHQQHQQQMYNNMYGAHAHAFMPQMHAPQQPLAYSMGLTSPTMGSYSPPRMAHRIPIVNPDNGNVVAIPEGPAPSPGWHQHHFVAVR
ncbi:hypothetical protein B0O80DRAFT_80608 [Mortierella sp. GBAus27b]|nr:hypothetical protein B0O80DRAFT_80608 [Mortierella sp. GBAus27b]